MYRMGDTNHIWEKFEKESDYWQGYFIKNGLADGKVNGEQNFIDIHIGNNRHWFPKEYFAKYHSEDWLKIQENWSNEIDLYSPYYLGGEFDERIKMVHFSNEENLIHKSEEKWINKYWQ